MSMDDDKISGLPQHILHHILCFLSQKSAVQTSVLSKSWRYLGSTRPKVEFRRRRIKELEETHPSVMDKTLQRYHDHKLSIQQFVVEIDYLVDLETISLLKKWVPIVVTNMGAKTLNLSFQSPYDFVLPSAVFQAAEFLEELYLRECKLSRIEPTEKLLLKCLQKLSLVHVYIEDETLEKVISSCPLIEYLVLYGCMRLRNIHLNNNNNLRHFKFYPHWTTTDFTSIEIGHAPSLETIRVYGCPNWFYHRRLCFAHLKSLCLTFVCHSTTKSFDIFSSNFPRLEDLTLDHCYGFQEFKLSSRSIKRLAITNSKEPIKATIDAPNILYFKYSSCFLQSSISFTSTCSHEWESYIDMYDFLENVGSDDYHGGSSSWLYKINELAKAFSQSKISMYLSQRFEIWNLKKVLLDNSTYPESVVVENLSLETHSSLSLPALTTCLLRIFRPRYIVEYHWLGYEAYDDEAKHHESLSKILVAERGRGTQFWPQDLEDMIMEDIDLAKEEYKPLKIGFQLKWKETEMS